MAYLQKNTNLYRSMIKIAFVDFWDDFQPENNFITKAFSEITQVEIVNPHNNPDILIYSIFGYENLYYQDCIKLYYTGENDVPDFNLCDYAISFHPIKFGDRHLRLPLYATWPSFEMLRSGNRMNIPSKHRDFCSFVVSNNFCAAPERNQIFTELSNYKFVASGGRYANNVGGPVRDKIDFLNQYKFNIAFENSRVDGYTTEKIFDALAARTIPIYWGNRDITNEVNKQSFIDICDFDSIAEAIEYIKFVDSNDDLYNEYITADPLLNNKFLHWEDLLTDFLNRIVESPIKYVQDYGLGGQIHLNALEKEELFHSTTMKRLLKWYKQLKKNK